MGCEGCLLSSLGKSQVLAYKRAGAACLLAKHDRLPSSALFSSGER